MPGGAALAWIMLGALALRLWSIKHGLPYVYNVDEEQHFVPRAVDMVGGSLNPHYFENPPALTYLLAAVFKLRFHAGFPFGSSGFRHSFMRDPTAVFTSARVVVALLGTLSVGLIYWAGARFYDRRVGLVAAVLMACAFLPVFYAKQALNDAVTLVPLTVALVGCLGVYERARWWEWALAGAAIGVAVDVKYTAGAMVVVLAIAALARAGREAADVEAANNRRGNLAGRPGGGRDRAEPVRARGLLALQEAGAQPGGYGGVLRQDRPVEPAGLDLLHLDAHLGPRLAAAPGRGGGLGAGADVEPGARADAGSPSRCSCGCSSAGRRGTSGAGTCRPIRR